MPLNEDLLQIKSYDGTGYAPVIDFGTWRVAELNHADKYDPKDVSYIERHNESDEVFVLLKGRCVLYIGEGDAQLNALHACAMEPLKIHNVRKGVWHTCAVSGDAKLLIVENRDTGKKNSDYLTLNDDQRAELVRLAEQMLRP